MTVLYRVLFDGTKYCSISEWAVYFGTPLIDTHTYRHTYNEDVRMTENYKSPDDMKRLFYVYRTHLIRTEYTLSTKVLTAIKQNGKKVIWKKRLQ